MKNGEAETLTAEEYKKLAEEHSKKLKESWKTFLITGLFMVALVVAVVIFSRAWFAYNDKVHADDSSISADNNVLFYLATLEEDTQGIYDKNEEVDSTSALAKALKRFWRIDSDGNESSSDNQYEKFSNLPNLEEGTTKVSVGDKNYIIGNAEGISLMVRDKEDDADDSNVNNLEQDDCIGPGSKGQITFYIISRSSALEKVSISISLGAYKLKPVKDAGADTYTGVAEKIIPAAGAEGYDDSDIDTKILNIIKGHILIFEGKDDDGNYTDRVIPEITEDGDIVFNLSDKTKEDYGFAVGEAVPITIYWIWPHRIDNVIYAGQDESVFIDHDATGYSELVTWADTNRKCIVSDTELATISQLATLGTGLNNDELNKWSAGYNKGDQLIGNNVAYFTWQIDAN